MKESFVTEAVPSEKKNLKQQVAPIWLATNSSYIRISRDLKRSESDCTWVNWSAVKIF